MSASSGAQPGAERNAVVTPGRSLFDLTDRVALVTGAGSGLGRAFAETLADAGAHVICADRHADTAEQTAGTIGKRGQAAVSMQVDVADEAAVAALLAETDARFGRLDILVNNAGISTNPVRTHEFPVADFDRLMSINLRGVFLCTRAALPIMLRQRGGSIVNIASVLGLGGYYPGFSAIGVNYAASKAAVIGLTRQVALEYAGDGIRCNAIAPGWHRGTALAAERRGQITPEEFARFEHTVTAAVPMGRRAEPQELAGLLLYLAADTSAYVTGQVFAHDGGWTAT
jgi:NAD(P)-dependent dehydrogenase (short-subunit alcohol dehydrogenase family)